jgi:hypothetical protein
MTRLTQAQTVASISPGVRKSPRIWNAAAINAGTQALPTTGVSAAGVARGFDNRPAIVSSSKGASNLPVVLLLVVIFIILEGKA